ncbi:MAG: hypothetical protein C4521_11145 [Actinobacteria bacterium]|nr:MAG: hypothetical protein C4521_11145 [Actinomycetota bacterium]
MPRFLVSSTQLTGEQCAQAVEEMSKDPRLLEKGVFGCRPEDNLAWAIVDAGNVGEVREMIAGTMRPTATIIEVRGMSFEAIREANGL